MDTAHWRGRDTRGRRWGFRDRHDRPPWPRDRARRRDHPAVAGDVLGGEAVAHRARADRRGDISGNSKMISSEQMPKRRPSLRICET